MAINKDELSQKYVQPVKTWWGSLSPKLKKLIMILAPILLVGMIGLVIWLNYQPYTVLYRNLDMAEAGQIMTSLEEKGIAAKTKDSGTILVPEDQADSLRMQLAMEGYPKSGLNYDFYIDNVDTMSTDSDRRTYKIYQLNNRLQDTIKTISGVKDAIVTVSLPESNGYVLNTGAPTATASVVVTMAGVETLTNAQVNGIKQLVSKGVIGMKAEDVAVIDGNTGEELGGNIDSVANRANDRLAIEKEIDKTVEEKVRQLLRPLVAEDDVIQVVATSRINTDNTLTQMKTYTPMNEESTTGVTSQENHYLEANDGSILGAGVPGAETNADVPNYPAVDGALEGQNFVNQYQYDYKVNEMLQEIQRGDVVLESLKVSVVIQSSVIDDSSIDDLTELVANTASVDPEDVFIYMQYTDDSFDTEEDSNIIEILRQNWWMIAIAVVILLLIIIFIVILLRRKKQKRMAEELAAQEEEARLAAEAAKGQLLDIQPELTEEETKQQQIMTQVREFAKEHPDVAAQIIRTWLKGDE